MAPWNSLWRRGTQFAYRVGYQPPPPRYQPYTRSVQPFIHPSGALLGSVEIHNGRWWVALGNRILRSDTLRCVACERWRIRAVRPVRFDLEQPNNSQVRRYDTRRFRESSNRCDGCSGFPGRPLGSRLAARECTLVHWFRGVPTRRPLDACLAPSCCRWLEFSRGRLIASGSESEWAGPRVARSET